MASERAYSEYAKIEALYLRKQGMKARWARSFLCEELVAASHILCETADIIISQPNSWRPKKGGCGLT